MATEVRTEHSHIVRRPALAGGIPTIAGSRISVASIVGQLRVGDTPEDILAAYPHLSPAAVYDAISFYFDHQAEIDQSIAANSLEAHAERHRFTVGGNGRLVFDRR